MLSTLLLTATLGIADAPSLPLDSSVDGPLDLLGTWEIVTLKAGKDDWSKNFASARWTFTRDALECPGGRHQTFVCSPRLDYIEDGHLRRGTYSITGDKLVWSFDAERIPITVTFRRVRE